MEPGNLVGVVYVCNRLLTVSHPNRKHKNTQEKSLPYTQLEEYVLNCRYNEIVNKYLGSECWKRICVFDSGL